MKDIKIVISDLDGTLLNDNSELTSLTLSVINKLISQGIMFVPCTGRVISQIPRDLLEHKDIKYIGSANGAMLHTAQGKECLYQKHVNINIVLRVCDQLKDFLQYSTLIYNGNYYSLYKMKEVANLYDPGFIDYINSSRYFVEDYQELLKEGDMGVEKIHFSFPDEKSKNACLQLIDSHSEDYLGLNVTSSHFSNLEIMHKDANKGEVAKYLLHKYKLKSYQLLVLGDNHNDIAMFHEAKYRVAMANAEKEVKNLASHIALHNNEDGAAQILEELLLR